MKKFIILLTATFLIGVVPSLLTGSSVEGLTLPALYPPKIVFPIVWTILFILMTISIYLATKYNDMPYIVYFIQLLINACWTFIFFGLKMRLFAFIWILILLVIVGYMTYSFFKYNKVSGYLLIPYIIWLLIAGYLNFAIYLLNK